MSQRTGTRTAASEAKRAGCGPSPVTPSALLDLCDPRSLIATSEAVAAQRGAAGGIRAADPRVDAEPSAGSRADRVLLVTVMSGVRVVTAVTNMSS